MHSPYHQAPPPRLGPLQRLCYSRPYAARPEYVADARHDFQAAAKASEIHPAMTEAALLCLSEVATNAAVHAKATGPFVRFHVHCSVRGRYRRFLRLAVWDRDGSHVPDLPDPAKAAALLEQMEWDTRGRGLLTVASLATNFGVDHGADLHGKVVWFEMPFADFPVLP